MAEVGGEREVDLYHKEGKAQYSTILGQAAAAAKGWRIMALLCSVACVVAVSGIAWIGGQSKIQPFLVVMKDDFLPVGVFASSQVPTSDERISRAVLARFVRDLREVTTDRALLVKRFQELGQYIKPSSPAFQKIQELLGDEKLNPLVLSQHLGIDVEIINVLEITNDTWQVDWYEHVRNKSGQRTQSRSEYRGNFVFEYAPTITPAMQLVNPIGFWVVDFNLQEI